MSDRSVIAACRLPLIILVWILLKTSSFNGIGGVAAFGPTPFHAPFSPSIRRTATDHHRILHSSPRTTRQNKPSTGTTTSLNLLVEVPPYFFTFTFPMLGILLSISKGFGRLRMEERAWEQRLEEAREKRLREDPTVTEIELRRKEAALEWSAYGKPRQEEEAALERERRGGHRRVKVLDREEFDTSDGTVREHRMNDDEIKLFELEYGIDYDPYYDDPYSEDELPEDMSYQVYKRYGDRIYSNGEIFYKDKDSGLYYRQGARPRNLSFW